jgi:PhnB protein
MKAIIPYINFNGKCREAMTFYSAIFNGHLELKEVRGSHFENTWSGSADDIVHASLTIHGNQMLMGSDMQDQLGYIKGSDFALSLDCTSAAEAHDIISRLSDGGRLLTPLATQPWGALFGAVHDKFGIKWILNFEDKIDTNRR